MRLRKQDLELWFLNILGLIVCARTMLVLTWGSRDASEGLNAKRRGKCCQSRHMTLDPVPMPTRPGAVT